MEKLYRELLKYGMDIAFEEYAEEILNSGKFIYNHAEDTEIFSFAYEDIIKGFAEVFGKKNIRCVQYAYPVEPAFLKSIGLYDLYPNLKPVNRINLINNLELSNLAESNDLTFSSVKTGILIRCF